VVPVLTLTYGGQTMVRSTIQAPNTKF